MTDFRQRTIIKVFRKYSNSLGPDALELVDEILAEHEIQDAEVESTLETLVKEYNKQDDASMKVSVDVLRRIYESLRDQGDTTSTEREFLDPESHLHIIDAFDMPLWHWSQERGTFEKHTAPLSPAGSAETRVLAMRNRLNIIRQSVLRNDHFAPSTLPSHDRERLVSLKSTKHMLGRPGERFLLMGMLTYNKEGKLCLEDGDGIVRLDISKLDEPGDGIFTEGCFALVEGEYNDDDMLEVIAMGQPPCESRETSRSIYAHIDFLGQGTTSLMEDAKYSIRIKEEMQDLNFFFLSDVWLDHSQTLSGLQKIFDNCVENSFIPKLIVLCGNFTSKPIARGNGRDLQQYQENFEALADLIASYPIMLRSTHFVLVPGPLDMTVNAVLPKRTLHSTLTAKLKSKVPKSHFASNPCRIKFFHQEIVVYREDTMARMLRNTVAIKPDVRGDTLKRFSMLDQGHLNPFAKTVLPTLADYDHALRLYPLPTALVLADKYDRFKMTYTGCHVFNPGSFVGKSLVFSTYTPSEMNSEECIVEMNN
ncbi:DNA polymerase alpha/epsilon subunit B domain containing protein [Amanita muscaria]